MVKKERHQYILERVSKEGRILTKEMVEEFGLAEDTVRKDFQELTAQGKLRRFHGGVTRIEDKPVDFNERIHQNPSVKQCLALRAVEFVKNEHVLYIDGGTTNLKVAENLPKDYVGTVITNSPTIALALCERPNVEVMMIGGALNKVTRVNTGTKAIEQIQKMNFECCLLGVSSLSADNGITYPISDEAMFKQEVLGRSKQVIVVTNKEKLELVATFFAADISVIDILITNEMDKDILGKYQSLGIEVVSEKI